MENMPIVIVGHVDHGKSTLIGRLLYDTQSLPEGVYEEVKQICEELGKEMEYAYLLDSLEEEREQNVTIDTTQIFFKTPKRDYVIIDAPGHVEFLKNMITGASQAEAAVLIVDINEGMQEQTKRHSYILKMLGLKQVVVLINKMDAVDYNKTKFEQIKEEVTQFLAKLDITPQYIIPVSASKGDNITNKSENMLWYDGLNFLDSLDSFNLKKTSLNKPLRFPIQDVYKIEDRRILVGRIETGKLKQGQEITFLPSDKKTKIKSVEKWKKEDSEAGAGESIGIVIEDPLFIERGEVACAEEVPKTFSEFETSIFWMDKEPLKTNDPLTLKCATQEVDCRIKEIKQKMNSSDLNILENQEDLNETEVGDVIIETEKPIVIENFNNIEELGRFVLVKGENTVAGGIIVI